MPQIYVFDEGPLSHFAEAGWLGLLQSYVGTNSAWVPDTVRRELGEGVDAHPHLRGVLEATWLEPHPVQSKDEQAAFGHYTERMLGRNNENLGECGVLAVAEANRAIAVVDDGDARKNGSVRGVQLKTTVSILCDLVNAKRLDLDLAGTVADHLLATEYRLPFERGGFKMFVLQNDLIQDPYGVAS